MPILGLKSNLASSSTYRFQDLKATTFDGNNDVVYIENDSDILIGTSQFLIGAWFYLTDQTTADGTNHNVCIVSKGSIKKTIPIDNAGIGMGYSTFSTDNWIFDIHHYTDESTGVEINLSYVDTIPKNTWTHIAGGRRTSGADSVYTLYINGSNVATETATDGGAKDVLAADGTIDDNTLEFAAGADMFSTAIASEMIGNISEVFYYKVGMTDAEVQTLYNSGKVYDHSSKEYFNDMALWWRMGDNPNDSTSTIYDNSGNGKNGTVSGNCSIIDKP